jgi:outer membrane protein assembly factor BamB
MFGRGAAASLITLACLLATVGPAGAQLVDNSPWPMYMHDQQHTGKSTALGPATGPVVPKFAPYKLANVPKSQPAVGPDGAVYMGVTHQPLCAVDGDTGALIWCTGGTADGNSSSPAVAVAAPNQPVPHDRTIYIGARDNALWAVNNDDHTNAWRYKIQLDGDVMSSPTITEDGTVYMTCGCLSAGLIWAMTSDGQVRWSIQVPNPINNSSITVSSKTPAQLGLPGDVVRRLYVGSNNGTLWAIDDLGGSGNDRVRVGWGFLPFGQKGTNYNSSPTVDKNGHVYWGSANGFFKVRDDGTQATLLWSKDDGGTVDNTAAVDNDHERVIVSTYRQGKRTLYAFDFDGNPVWPPLTGASTAVNQHQQGPSPVIDAAGNVYAAIGRQVYAFDSAGNSLWPSPYVLLKDAISLALGNGILFFGTEDKFLYALVSP